MKRYRWLSFFVDTERNLVRNPDFAADPMAASGAIGSVGMDYGLSGIQAKYCRWLDISVPDLCAPVIYHDLLREVESAYVHGDPYPALTSACCLGERILNHLILDLRDDFRSHPRFKEVYGKDSFESWEHSIKVLSDWGVLTGEIPEKLRTLLQLRNPAIHFGSMADRMTAARTSLQLIYDVTSNLFGLKSGHFFVCHGEIYVAREKQELALIKRFILPHCSYVGYLHRIEGQPLNQCIVDDAPYAAEQITDDEFSFRRMEHRQGSARRSADEA